jgi:hypothetical protein
MTSTIYNWWDSDDGLFYIRPTHSWWDSDDGLFYIRPTHSCGVGFLYCYVTETKVQR